MLKLLACNKEGFIVFSDDGGYFLSGPPYKESVSMSCFGADLAILFFRYTPCDQEFTDMDSLVKSLNELLELTQTAEPTSG